MKKKISIGRLKHSGVKIFVLAFDGQVVHDENDIECFLETLEAVAKVTEQHNEAKIREKVQQVRGIIHYI